MLNVSTAAEIEQVRAVEAFALQLPEEARVPVGTQHLIHAGTYTRTLFLPAGTGITTVFMTVPMVMIVTGHVRIWTAGRWVDIETARGEHKVIAAHAGRKNIWHAVKDTTITTVFPTSATTVRQAEEEMTPEADLLVSRRYPELNFELGVDS